MAEPEPDKPEDAARPPPLRRPPLPEIPAAWKTESRSSESTTPAPAAGAGGGNKPWVKVLVALLVAFGAIVLIVLALFLLLVAACFGMFG